MTVAGYLKARYKSDALVVITSLGLIVMCIGTFLFLFFVLRAGGGLAAIDAGLAANLPNVYDDIFSKYTPGGLLSYWILVGFGTLGLPQTAVRAMEFKDTKSMHRESQRSSSLRQWQQSCLRQIRC